MGPLSRLAAAGWVVGGVVVIAVVAVAAVRVLSHGTASGGAASPTAAVSEFASAIDHGDYLAAVDLLPPDERQDLPDAVTQLKGKIETSDATGGDHLPQVDLGIAPQPATDAAPDVATVQLAGSVGVDLSNLGGDVGQVIAGNRLRWTEELPTGGYVSRPIEAVAIRQHGRWYLDPLLTAGDYLAARLDLPAGDFSQVDFHSGSGGATPDDAVNQLAEAISSKNPSAAADVAASADERFLRVFGAAISSFVDRWGESVGLSGLELADQSDGEVIVRGAEVDAPTHYGSVQATVQSNCVDWNSTSSGESRQLCALSADGLRSELGIDALPIRTTKDGGEYRVDILGTLTGLVDQVAKKIDAGAVNGIFDEFAVSNDAPLGAAAPVRVGQTVSGAFDGHQSKLFELHAHKGETIKVTGETSVQVNIWEPDGDTWDRAAGTNLYDRSPAGLSTSYTVAAAEPLKVQVVERPPQGCVLRIWGRLEDLVSGCWWTPPGTRYRATISG